MVTYATVKLVCWNIMRMGHTYSRKWTHVSWSGLHRRVGGIQSSPVRGSAGGRGAWWPHPVVSPPVRTHKEREGGVIIGLTLFELYGIVDLLTDSSSLGSNLDSLFSSAFSSSTLFWGLFSGGRWRSKEFIYTFQPMWRGRLRQK